MSEPDSSIAPPPQPAPATAQSPAEEPAPAPAPAQAQATAPAMEDPQPRDPKKPETAGGIALSIWPPTQRTREAVVSRLVSTLSSPSVLSKRYGTIPLDEASVAATLIEEAAYSVAFTASSTEDDGIELLQIYSREISKRMLDSVKSRAATSASTTAQDQTPTPVVATSEKITSIESTTES